VTERGVGLTTDREVSLVEILDRALGAGVVLTGDVTISLADVDLVYLSLRLLVGSVGTIEDGRCAVDSDAVSIERG
jgi:Gas vesicle protein